MDSNCEIIASPYDLNNAEQLNDLSSEFAESNYTSINFESSIYSFELDQDGSFDKYFSN